MTGMVLDTSLTINALIQPEWQELNRYAVSRIEAGNFDQVLIAKMALTAVMIGSYALASKIGSRWKMPIEKAMQIGNMIIWGAVAWNLVNYGAELILK